MFTVFRRAAKDAFLPDEPNFPGSGVLLQGSGYCPQNPPPLGSYGGEAAQNDAEVKLEKGVLECWYIEVMGCQRQLFFTTPADL
jgi:hypothetical protein